MDSVSSLVCEIVERHFGEELRVPVTNVFEMSVNIVRSMFQRGDEAGWPEKRWASFERRVNQFKKKSWCALHGIATLE